MRAAATRKTSWKGLQNLTLRVPQSAHPAAAAISAFSLPPSGDEKLQSLRLERHPSAHLGASVVLRPFGRPKSQIGVGLHLHSARGAEPEAHDLSSLLYHR